MFLESYSLKNFQTNFFHLVPGIQDSSMSFYGLIAHFFLYWILLHYMDVP